MFKNINYIRLFGAFSARRTQFYTIYGPVLCLLGNETNQKINERLKSLPN